MEYRSDQLSQLVEKAFHSTAGMVCMQRMIHTQWNGDHQFKDECAGLFIPDNISKEIAELSAYDEQARNRIIEQGGDDAAVNPLMISHPARRGRGHVVLRTLHSEHTFFEQRKTLSCLQYVILGAGYDTFALRNPDIPVFEVDQPDIQHRKRAIIQRRLHTVPDNLHFIQVDLQRQSLSDVLTGAGNAYRADQPGFFCCLGLSYYLDSATIESTLRDIRSFAVPGSLLAMDYMLDRQSLINAVQTRYRDYSSEQALQELLDADTLHHDYMTDFAAEKGEPIKSLFAARQLEALCKSCGFQIVEHLDGAALEQRYGLLENCPPFDLFPQITLQVPVDQ